MLTVTDLKGALPRNFHAAATQEFADKINQISGDPDFAENVRNNFISYTQVLSEGRYKLPDYLNAVVYVSFSLMGFNNEDCYKRTFPDRYNRLKHILQLGSKEISAYVAAYNKNKLVNLIREQTLIPVHVLNADIYQKAINKQVQLMMTASSEKVQMEAANSLLTQLKPPEAKKVELEIGMSAASGMDELRSMMSGLAQRQQELIAAGVQTKTIAHQGLGQGLSLTNDLVDGNAKQVATPQSNTIEGTLKDVTPNT